MAANPDWGSHPRAFSRLVADLAPNEVAFRTALASAKPAARRYVVLFSPRSGSTWLSLVLAGTGLLGRPLEYIHPDQVVGHARAAGTTDPAGLLAVLLRQRQTPNGVFGIKARALDILLFGEAAFFAELGDDAAYFCLWRENIVAQGVSLYRAVASGRWHSYDAARPPPQYDAAAISHWISQVAEVEHANEQFLCRHGIHAQRLRYEILVPDRHTAIAIFATALGVTIPPIALTIMRTLAAVSDDWNQATEERFRSEYPEMIAALESRRAHQL